MAVVVEVVSPASGGTESTNRATAIEVVRTTDGPVSTSTGVSVVDVVGANVVLQAVVREDAPANPYEGQVWIVV